MGKKKKQSAPSADLETVKVGDFITVDFGDGDIEVEVIGITSSGYMVLVPGLEQPQPVTLNDRKPVALEPEEEEPVALEPSSSPDLPTLDDKGRKIRWSPKALKGK